MTDSDQTPGDGTPAGPEPVEPATDGAAPSPGPEAPATPGAASKSHERRDRALLVLALLLGGLLAFVAVPALFGTSDTPAGEFMPDTQQFQAVPAEQVEAESGDPELLGEAPGSTDPAGGGTGSEGPGPAGGESQGTGGAGPIAAGTGGAGPEPADPGEAPGPEAPAAGPGPEEPAAGPGPEEPGPGIPNPGIPAGPGGLAPQDVGGAGCLSQCIVKALVTPGIASSDLGLEVNTTTPVRLRVHLSKQKNQINPSPDAQSFANVTEWSTTLDGLDWDTEYHIRVRARDEAGAVAWRVGVVRTPKQVAVPGGGLANPQGGAGCTMQCIDWARLYPIDGSPNLELRTNSTVPATMRVRVGGQAPAFHPDGVPYFPAGEVHMAASNQLSTDWSTVLPLESGKNYFGIVSATDGDGNAQYRTGSFSSGKHLGGPGDEQPLDVLVTFHKIHVSDDADNTPGNRTGELAFRFSAGGTIQPGLATGRHKVKAPEWLNLDDGDVAPGRAAFVQELSGPLEIRVQGIERDNGFGMCFGSPGNGMDPDTSGRFDDGPCEWEWNTAEAQIDLHAVVPQGALPNCTGFGWDSPVTGDLCIVLTADGEDPAFEVFVTIDVLDP